MRCGPKRHRKEKKVKPADTPDSVHGDCSPRDRHSSGPTVACRLGAAYPPAERAASSLAYLALLRAEIARFTRTEPARLCCSDPHLTVERCYLLRCPVQSGRSSDAVFPRLRQRRSGRLYGAHCRAVSPFCVMGVARPQAAYATQAHVR